MALALGEALVLAAAAFTEVGFLEIGFLTVDLKRGFFELVDEAGFTGEPDATDMAIIMWQVQYDSNVFILGARLLISGCADFYSLLIASATRRDWTRDSTLVQ